MTEVNLRKYKNFWDTFKKDVADFTGDNANLPRHDIAKQWIKEWYGIDVDILPTDPLGICRMEESQFTWFILRWS